MTRRQLTTRLALAVAAPAVVLAGVGIASAGDDTPTRTAPVSSIGDLRGNCDEAEHAGDPECAGVAGAATSTTAVPTTAAPTTAVPTTAVPPSAPAPTATPSTPPAARPRAVAPDPGVDVSGPCDEAEHANDPRCTGGLGAPGSGRHHGGRDDSGHHRGGDDDRGHDDGHRRHGDDDPRGRGSDDDGPDDSGHGRGRGRGSDD